MKIQKYRGRKLNLFKKCIKKSYEIFDPDKLARKNNVFFNILNRILNNCYIAFETVIPKDLRICYGSVIVASGVRFGKNVIIGQGVTIGGKNGGYPEIGNNVRIYANSVVVGKIKIGNNVVIGANSFVDKDIQDNSVFYKKSESILRKLESYELKEHSL